MTTILTASMTDTHQTLQATVDTWREIAASLSISYDGVGRSQDRLAREIERQIGSAAGEATGSARVTLLHADAEAVRRAGR